MSSVKGAYLAPLTSALSPCLSPCAWRLSPRALTRVRRAPYIGARFPASSCSRFSLRSFQQTACFHICAASVLECAAPHLCSAAFSALLSSLLCSRLCFAFVASPFSSRPRLRLSLIASDPNRIIISLPSIKLEIIIL